MVLKSILGFFSSIYFLRPLSIPHNRADEIVLAHFHHTFCAFFLALCARLRCGFQRLMKQSDGIQFSNLNSMDITVYARQQQRQKRRR